MIRRHAISTPLRLLVIAGALCLIAASSTRYDWSTADISYLRDAKYLAEAAPSRALCHRVIGLEPAKSEWPTPAQAAALKHCDSEALLYGIGRPADPVAARHCALIERAKDLGDDPSPSYFTGPGILAVAYANGWGGPRDIDRAIHMVCGIEDAAAATKGRIASLQGSAKHKPGARPFGICDDASSGASGAICATHESRIAEQGRIRTIAAWKRNWPPAGRTAFDRAYANMRSYADTAHALDCYGGTAAAQCAIDGAEGDMQRFIAKIGALLGHNPPPPVPPVENRANAATDAGWWARDLRDLNGDDRQAYEDNGRATIAARARFERELLAFAATIPATTPHAVRLLFADL